jgi:hypothetical protein
MAKKIKITQMRSVHGSKVQSRDAMMRQAIADDERNNNGLMFGRSVSGFFTENGAYPEHWDCIQVGRNRAYLRRTPTHPMQTTAFYCYEPSTEFGGRHTQPRFGWVSESEVGCEPLENCE